jgi:hypothetical protein
MGLKMKDDCMNQSISYRQQIPGLIRVFDRHPSSIGNIISQRERLKNDERWVNDFFNEFFGIFEAAHFGLPVPIETRDAFDLLKLHGLTAIERGSKNELRHQINWQERWLELSALSLIFEDDTTASTLAGLYQSESSPQGNYRYDIETIYTSALCLNCLFGEPLPSCQTMERIVGSHQDYGDWVTVLAAIRNRDSTAFCQSLKAVIHSHSKILAKELKKASPSGMFRVSSLAATIALHVAKRLGIDVSSLGDESMAFVWTKESLGVDHPEKIPRLTLPPHPDVRSDAIRTLMNWFEKAGLRMALYPPRQAPNDDLTCGFWIPIVIDTSDAKAMARLIELHDPHRFLVNPAITSKKKVDLDVVAFVDLISGMSYPLIRTDEETNREVFENGVRLSIFGVEAPSTRPEWLIALQLRFIDAMQSKLTPMILQSSLQRDRQRKREFQGQCAWVRELSKLAPVFHWAILTKFAIKNKYDEALAAVRG